MPERYYTDKFGQTVDNCKTQLGQAFESYASTSFKSSMMNNFTFLRSHFNNEKIYCDFQHGGKQICDVVYRTNFDVDRQKPLTKYGHPHEYDRMYIEFKCAYVREYQTVDEQFEAFFNNKFSKITVPKARLFIERAFHSKAVVPHVLIMGFYNDDPECILEHLSFKHFHMIRVLLYKPTKFDNETQLSKAHFALVDYYNFDDYHKDIIHCTSPLQYADLMISKSNPQHTAHKFHAFNLPQECECSKYRDYYKWGNVRK